MQSYHQMITLYFHNINPYLSNIPFLYLPKTSENLWFSGIFRGYEMGTLARKRLTHFLPNFVTNGVVQDPNMGIA